MKHAIALQVLAVGLIVQTIVLWTQCVRQADSSEDGSINPNLVAVFLISLASLIVVGHVLHPKMRTLGVSCLTIGYGIIAIAAIVPGCN